MRAPWAGPLPCRPPWQPCVEFPRKSPEMRGLQVTAKGGSFVVGLNGEQVQARPARSGSRCGGPKRRAWGAEGLGSAWPGGWPHYSHPRPPQNLASPRAEARVTASEPGCLAVAEILLPSWRKLFPEPPPSGSPPQVPDAASLLLTVLGGCSGPDRQHHICTGWGLGLALSVFAQRARVEHLLCT